MFDIALLIGGKSRPASTGQTFERRNPLSGEVASRAAAASIDDARAAADAAAGIRGKLAHLDDPLAEPSLCRRLRHFLQPAIEGNRHRAAECGLRLQRDLPFGGREHLEGMIHSAGIVAADFGYRLDISAGLHQALRYALLFRSRTPGRALLIIESTTAKQPQRDERGDEIQTSARHARENASMTV